MDQQNSQSKEHVKLGWPASTAGTQHARAHDNAAKQSDQ